MIFPRRSKYEKPTRFFGNSGERYKIEYQLRIDKEGREVLEPVGQTDLQAYIDSHEPSVNIQNILEQFRNGQVDALERAKGFYADVTQLPVTLQDIFNMNKKGEEFFEKLPVEVKNQFQDNYVNFLFNPEKMVEVLTERQKKLDGEIDSIVQEEVKQDGE